VPRELAKMCVEHEADRVGERSTHSRDGRYVDGLESRKDCYTIAVQYPRTRRRPIPR
jgi:hypothetical protein